MGKIKAGATSFEAAEFNRHVEASDAYHLTRATGIPGRGGNRNTDTNIIKVKNNSGGDRRAGDILEFTGLAITNFDDVPMAWLTGGSPTLVNGFCVLLRASPNGSTEMEDCQVAGACIAYVNITDADHKYATVAASTYVLQSTIIGPARILCPESSGTGEKKCLVLLNDVVGECLVKNATGSDIAINSSGTFQLWTGTPGSESYANCDVTAYNKTSTAFKNGKFGAVSYLNGQAYAVPFQS